MTVIRILLGLLMLCLGVIGLLATACGLMLGAGPLLGVGLLACLLAFGIGMVVFGVTGETPGITRQATADEIAQEGLSTVDRRLLGRCPSCALLLRLDAEQCRKCGALFGADSTWRPVKLEAEPAADKAAASKAVNEDLSRVDRSLLGKCPNCAALLRLTARECRTCGALFGTDSKWRPAKLE